MSCKRFLLGGLVCAAVLAGADEAIPARVTNANPVLRGRSSVFVELGAPSYAAPLRSKEAGELFGDDTVMNVAAPADAPCGYATRRIYPLQDLPAELEIEAKGSGVVELCVFFCDEQGAIIGKKGCSFTIPKVNYLVFREFKCNFRLRPPKGTAGVRFGWVVAAGGDVTVKDFKGEFDD